MKWVVLLVAAVACSSDAFKPNTENVTGEYQLQSFTTDSAGVHKDWIAAGLTLDLMLGPGGIVIGELWAPLDSTFVFSDMSGTWQLNGNTVHFTQNADTFVRDVDWIASKDHLSGDETFGAVRVRVVLQRQAAP